MVILALLLLQASNIVHVDGVELVAALLLVGGELFLVQGLHADGGIIANAHDQNATTLPTTAVVLLLGEGDVNLRHVVGRVRGLVGVCQHWLPVLVEDQHARMAVSGLDGQTAVVTGALGVLHDVVVLWEGVFAHSLLVVSHSSENKQDSAEEQAEDHDYSQDDDQQVDDVGAALVVLCKNIAHGEVVPGDQLRYSRHGGCCCWYWWCCSWLWFGLCVQVSINECDMIITVIMILSIER